MSREKTNRTLRNRTLFAGAVIAIVAVAFAAIVLLLTRDEATVDVPDKTKEENTGFVLRTLDEDVVEIYLENRETSLHFVKRDGAWDIAFDEPVTAYGNAILSIEAVMEQVIAEEQIESNAPSLELYGLDEPQATVRAVTESGKEYTLRLGDSVVGANYYFVIDGDPGVYSMSANEAGVLLANMGAFVDLALVRSRAEEIVSVTYVNGDVITIEKKSEEELAASQTADALFGYAMRSPVHANADINEPQTLFGEVAGLRAANYDPDARMETFGLSETSPYIEVVTEKGTDKFFVAKPDETSDVSYIKKVGSAGIYEVSDTMLAFMKKTAFDMVDKHIAMHDINEVSRIVILSGEGTVDIRLNGSAQVNGQSVPMEKVRSFYQSLISLTYDNSLAKEATPGATEVTIRIETEQGVDETQYAACGAMDYAVYKVGVFGFTIKKKYVEKILTLAGEMTA